MSNQLDPELKTFALNATKTAAAIAAIAILSINAGATQSADQHTTTLVQLALTAPPALYLLNKTTTTNPPPDRPNTPPRQVDQPPTEKLLSANIAQTTGQAQARTVVNRSPSWRPVVTRLAGVTAGNPTTALGAGIVAALAVLAVFA